MAQSKVPFSSPSRRGVQKEARERHEMMVVTGCSVRRQSSRRWLPGQTPSTCCAPMQPAVACTREGSAHGGWQTTKEADAVARACWRMGLLDANSKRAGLQQEGAAYIDVESME